MVRPEILLRYPILNLLQADQMEAIAMAAQEESFSAGTLVFKELQPADSLYILLKGSIELYFTVEVEYHPELSKELHFSLIEPGEVFGISAIIEPHILTSSARTISDSQVIKIDATPLRELMNQDQDLAYAIIQEIANLALQRLNQTRLQLAAAYAPNSSQVA